MNIGIEHALQRRDIIDCSEIARAYCELGTNAQTYVRACMGDRALRLDVRNTNIRELIDTFYLGSASKEVQETFGITYREQELATWIVLRLKVDRWNFGTFKFMAEDLYGAEFPSIEEVRRLRPITKRIAQAA